MYSVEVPAILNNSQWMEVGPEWESVAVTGISNTGLVIGNAWEGSSHAVFWLDGVWLAIPGLDGLVSSYAVAVNDSAVIVGYGYDEFSAVHTFVYDAHSEEEPTLIADVIAVGIKIITVSWH